MSNDIRQLVYDALDEVAGLRGQPAFLAALAQGEDVALAALEMDSLTRFEVMMRFEEALGIELDDDDIENVATIGGLVAFLEAARDGIRG